MLRFEEIKSKYQREGFCSAAKEVPVQGWSFAKENPYKTAATFVAIAAVTSLTTAYFLSPAYAAYVGMAGVKAAALVSPAIAGLSAFAIAHPLIASLVVVTAVAALIAVPVYAYKSSNQSSQIDAQIDAVKTAFSKLKKEGTGNIKGKGDNDSPLTILNEMRRPFAASVPKIA